VAGFAERPTSTLLAEGFLAPHPEVACDRISERFGCTLTATGNECAGIGSIRRLIAEHDRETRFARCLLLTAAHTHWGDKMIVESFDATRNVFLAGPVREVGSVYPISFVFSLEGPIPYEWADDTVPVDADDLQAVHEFIVKLNSKVVAHFSPLPIPLGVMIDHRFKTSMWDEQLFSFAEGPHNEEDGRAVIRPVFESALFGETRYPDQIQVAWSALPVVVEPSLADLEQTALRRLERSLENRSPPEAIAFVSELEAALARQTTPSVPGT
jgi:hypothetical protein